MIFKGFIRYICVPRGTFAPFEGNYSKELVSLVKNLLEVDPSKRPKISEVLSSVQLMKMPKLVEGMSFIKV